MYGLVAVLLGCSVFYWVARNSSLTGGNVEGAASADLGSAKSSEPAPANLKEPSLSSSAPQSVEGGAQSSQSPVGVLRAGAPRQLDWNRYPGTLSDQISTAFASRDGDMAIDLAAKLQECSVNSKTLEIESSRGGEANSSSEVRQVRNARLQEYQRQMASCQTVSGDLRQVRQRLLDVAIEKKVFGAASQAFLDGGRSAPLLQQLVDDAQNGDVSALFQMAINKTSLFGVDADTQTAVRYALKMAAEDPAVGARVKFYFEQAQVLAVPLAGEKYPKFDFSDIDGGVRARGLAISAKIVDRMIKS